MSCVASHNVNRWSRLETKLGEAREDSIGGRCGKSGGGKRKGRESEGVNPFLRTDVR